MCFNLLIILCPLSFQDKRQGLERTSSLSEYEDYKEREQKHEQLKSRAPVQRQGSLPMVLPDEEQRHECSLAAIREGDIHGHDSSRNQSEDSLYDRDLQDIRGRGQLFFQGFPNPFLKGSPDI